MLGTSFHFKEMFGLTLCLCLMSSISHVAAQGYFSKMAGGLEGMDPYAQQRQMGLEFIDAQMEAAEALPPMQQKQYIQQLNRQKMALSQNFAGYPNQQQHQRSSANRAVYQIQAKPNNVQTPYGVSRLQNSGYPVPYYMQQHRQAFSGFQPKPQTNVFVVDSQSGQYPSVPQAGVLMPNQKSQSNLMSSIPQNGLFQIMIPRGPLGGPMPSSAQVPQIIIVSRGKPNVNSSPTIQPTSQPTTPKPTQSTESLPKRKNFGTTVKPKINTPSDVATSFTANATTPKASDAAKRMTMIKTSNSQNDTGKQNVNIHGVIDDALKAHIKSKQKALEATLQAQLLAKQKALESALKTQILNKHKSLEATLNAEIMTKHQNSEAALRDQILQKQRTLESLLKAQMLAKHKALEAAMEALTKQNLKKAQSIKTSDVTETIQTPKRIKNEQNIPNESKTNEKITRSNSREIKLIDRGTQQQIFGKSQFRPRIGSETLSFKNSRGVNILRNVPHLTRFNGSTETKKTPTQTYEQKTEDYTTEPTYVPNITTTPKPKIVQSAKVPEMIQESQQPLLALNGDISSSRRIPQLMIRLSANEPSQRNVLQNMNSSDRKRLVNYFLTRMVHQPQRETSRITRTVTA